MNFTHVAARSGFLLPVILAALFSGCASTHRPNRNNGLVGAASNTTRSASQNQTSGVVDNGVVFEKALGGSALIADQISKDLNGEGLRYRTSPGDMLALSFFRKPAIGLPGMYVLNIGDRLFINVADQEQFSKEVTVRPDGRFSYYRIGEIVAMGKTVPEIADELEKRFQEVIPAAKLSVFLEEGNVMVKEFLDTLTSNEMQGSSRPLRIHSDGFINFPLIGEMHMVGKSLPVISQELETKYNEIFLGSLSVSFTLIDDTDGNVSVVGEVHKPGRFKIHGPTRVAELLAMAGGPNILAHKTAVLIKKTGENRYSLYYVQLDTDAKDLSQGFLNGALLTMNPQDILIVPKSNIGKINLWVHKYIERLFLFRGTHISINGRWDDL